MPRLSPSPVTVWQWPLYASPPSTGSKTALMARWTCTTSLTAFSRTLTTTALTKPAPLEMGLRLSASLRPRELPALSPFSPKTNASWPSLTNAMSLLATGKTSSFSLMSPSSLLFTVATSTAPPCRNSSSWPSMRLKVCT